MSRFFDNAERPEQEEELDIDVAEVERPDVEVPDEPIDTGDVDNEPIVIVDEDGKEKVIGEPVPTETTPMVASTSEAETKGEGEGEDGSDPAIMEAVPMLDLPHPGEDEMEQEGEAAEEEPNEDEPGETAPLKASEDAGEVPVETATKPSEGEKESGMESPISDEEMEEIVKHEERTDEDDDAMFGEAALAEEDKVLDVSGNDEVTEEEVRQAAQPARKSREEMDAIMRYEEDEEPRSEPAKCCVVS